MKAVVVEEYGPAESMRILESELPVPDDNQVLVKIHYAGVNPVATYHRSGSNGYTPATPFTPGLDGSGEVVALGKRVSRFAINDRVYFAPLRIIGSYSEYWLAREDEILPLPESLSFEEGAGLYVPYFTAYTAVISRGKAETGETILIHGASGAVGQACIQIAKAKDMKVIATAGSEKGLKLLQDLGADIVVNHRDEGHMSRAVALNDNEEIPLIIEFLADRNLQEDMEICRRNGRIIIVGNRGETTINARLTMKKNLDIRGLSLFNATRDELNHIHEAVTKGADEGWLKPRCHRIFDLEDIAEAHDLVTTGPSLGRILIRTGG
jgi:NADPH2:quinone reductase